MFEVSNSDEAFNNKEIIIGISRNGKHKAYPMSELAQTNGEVVDIFQKIWCKIYYGKNDKTAVIISEDGILEPSVTMYWFALYAFHPETYVYRKK